MQLLDKITAVFKPKDLTTLRPEAFQYIGFLGVWQAGWIIEDGVYQGQWAMIPINNNHYNFGWVPEEDLEIK